MKLLPPRRTSSSGGFPEQARETLGVYSFFDPFANCLSGILPGDFLLRPDIFPLRHRLVLQQVARRYRQGCQGSCQLRPSLGATPPSGFKSGWLTPKLFAHVPAFPHTQKLTIVSRNSKQHSKKTAGAAVKGLQRETPNDQRSRLYGDTAQSHGRLRVVLRRQVEGSQASWPQRVEEDSGQAGIERFNQARMGLLWCAVAAGSNRAITRYACECVAP